MNEIIYQGHGQDFSKGGGRYTVSHRGHSTLCLLNVTKAHKGGGVTGHALVTSLIKTRVLRVED